MPGAASERPAVGQNAIPTVQLRDFQAQRRLDAVQQSPLFADVPKKERLEILAHAHEKHYTRRQTIFLLGDPVSYTILLSSGCAKIVQIGQSGSEVILRLSGPGEVVGAVGLAQQDRNCSMAQSLNDSTALLWDAATFEDLLHRYKTLRRNSVHILSRRLCELEARFMEVSTERVAARLSHQLLRLHEQVGKRVNGGIEIGLSREELAQLTGTTLFTVSRLLSNWDERGIVRTKREAVSISDLDALVQLSQAE